MTNIDLIITKAIKAARPMSEERIRSHVDNVLYTALRDFGLTMQEASDVVDRVMANFYLEDYDCLEAYA